MVRDDVRGHVVPQRVDLTGLRPGEGNFVTLAEDCLFFRPNWSRVFSMNPDRPLPFLEFSGKPEHSLLEGDR